MGKGGNGNGSASIILIFSVLCMTIFALISFKTAISDKSLVDTQEKLVLDYYATDMYAEQILAKILNADVIPESVDDVDIIVSSDTDTQGKTVSFVTPMSDKKELSVEVLVYQDFYDVVKWKTQNTDLWVADDTLQVWSGENVN